MSDLVKRLRDHVNVRGGPTMKNGAWDMMLEAADRIDELEAENARLRNAAGHPWVVSRPWPNDYDPWL